MSLKIFLPLLLGSCILSSCQEEKPNGKANFEQDGLIGRWELSKGYRNGKETETLTGTYYEFGADGFMKTNLTPTTMEQTYEYSFANNEIKQQGEPPIVYSVDTLTQDLLALSMVINNFPFKIELKKSIPPANLEASDSSAQDSLKEL